MLKDIVRILQEYPENRSVEEHARLLKMAKNIQFFQDLELRTKNQDIIKRCVDVLSYQALDSGQVLFNIGEIGTLFYIILSGKVGVFIKLPSEDNKFELKQVNVLSAGTSFGELALLNDNVYRTATIIALTDCQFAVMNKKSYIEILSEIENQKLNEKISFLYKMPFL